MPGRLGPRTVARQADAACAGQLSVVDSRDLAAAGDEPIELAQLARAEGSLKVGQSVVVPQALHLMVPRTVVSAQERRIPDDAVGTEGAGEVGDPVVVRQDRAPLTGSDRLDG